MVLPSRYAVNETEAYLHCGLEGLGLIQLSALAASPHLRSGRLREVLADARCEPVQLSIVYPQARATAAVKAFVQWVLDSSRPVLAA
jgi:LysR family transcriptional regulator for bpeEF and oprC